MGQKEFVVWAPLLKNISLEIVDPGELSVPMKKDERGYWRVLVDDVAPGSLYCYRFEDGTKRPDPASRFQPYGVHGPSQVIDPDEYRWEDFSWKGLPWENFIIYELHVGTFTKEGTFVATADNIEYLKDLGITAVELMPVAQFSGDRNWGYDGVYPFAPHNSYGEPQKLKKLIDCFHKQGLAVILDVVYNHLGPEGNYLGEFGPYFTNRYKTPWGQAPNFDGPYSDEVRNFFIENALYWVTEFHIDALRIDAIHGIFDFSALHFLRELSESIHKQAVNLKRHIYIIAESDLNDVRVINPVEIGGYGLDAQWNDDFHHALHALLTDEKFGYYEDFGSINDLVRALRDGFVYDGRYSAYRKRRHGNSSRGRPPHQFIVFSQNHDQVGNRPRGDRLCEDQSFEKLKLASAVIVFSPFIPLLFMGEEYGEKAPFPYFIGHSDTGLVEAVRKGRKEGFAGIPGEDTIPDPYSPETFTRAQLDLNSRFKGSHKTLFEFYKHIIKLRKSIPIFSNHKKDVKREIYCFEEKKTIAQVMYSGDDGIISVCSFLDSPMRLDIPLANREWNLMLDSSSEQWGGPGTIPSPLKEKAPDNLSFSMNAFSMTLFRKVRISGQS